MGARNMMMASEMREARAEGGWDIRSPVPVLKAFSEAAFDDDERLLRQEVHKYGLIIITGIIIIIIRYVTGIIIIIIVVVVMPLRVCSGLQLGSCSYPQAKSLPYRTCDFLRMSVISSC